MLSLYSALVTHFHFIIYVLRATFGMGKEPFLRIFAKVSSQLERPREASTPTVIPALWRFLIFLQFMRTNGFQRAVGTQHVIRVSQPVVCKTVNEVAKIIADMLPEVSS